MLTVVELLLQQGQVVQLGDNRRKLLFEELADTFLHLVHGGANLTGVRGLTIWRRGESSVSPREEQVNPQLTLSGAIGSGGQRRRNG